jgi:hypothetical protein
MENKTTVYQPTLHRPVPLQTRVIVPENYLGQHRATYGGRVVGIASVHVMFMYIVLLDEPLMTDYGVTNAIVCDGANLKNEDGEYAWRLTFEVGK